MCRTDDVRVSLRRPGVRLRRVAALALCACLMAGGGTTLLAHTVGENYIFLNFRDDAIDGRFEIHFDDLRDKLGVDVGGNPETALPAVRARAAVVHDYIRRHFAVSPPEGDPYVLEFTREEVIGAAQGGFAQYFFSARTGPLPDQLEFRHDMLYEQDRFHRGLVLVEYNAKTDRHYGEEYVAMVFGPTSSRQSLDLTSVPTLLRPRDMIWQGVLHIWIGIDHILFLVALMLPTVLVFGNPSWKPVPRFSRAAWRVLKIVTVFTIAHSITLVLAALGFVNVPSRLVESVIALSILLVALNNITGRVRDGSLAIILGLGLFHGLGFASVMGHLPIRMESLVKGVIGFNIGVELGQLAIVLALFPALFLARKLPLYVPVVLRGGSAALGLVACVWFVQRAFGLE